MTDLEYKVIKIFDLISLLNKNIFPVVIPLLFYLKFHSIGISLASCILWRSAAYFSQQFNLKSTYAQGISILVIILCLLFRNPFVFLFLFSVSLFFYYMSNPFTIDKYSSKNTKLIAVAGMILSGLVIILKNNIIAFFIVLYVLSFIKTLCTEKRIKSPKRNINDPELIDIYNKDFKLYDIPLYIGAFSHNAHYYIYSITLPVLFLKMGIPLVLIGLCFSLGWVYYVFKENVLNFLLNKLNLSLNFLICIGYLFTAVMLYLMMKIKVESIFLLSWFITGFTAGVAEGFWYNSKVKLQISSYKVIWIIGGIIGTIVSTIIWVSFRQQYFIFIASIIFCFIGFLSTAWCLFFESRKG